MSSCSSGTEHLLQYIEEVIFWKENVFVPVPHCLDDCGFVVEPEVSQKDKDQYSILLHIYEILKDGNNKTEKETQMYRTDFGTPWEKARVGCSERIALKQVYCQG